MPTILVVNSGSSSLKAAIWNTDTAQCLATALAERLGTEAAELSWQRPTEASIADGIALAQPTHAAALQQLFTDWADLLPGVQAVGHRVVHGGERFHAASLIDRTVRQAIEDVSHLAPLHNPANLEGIDAAQDTLPNLPHVAVFDTAFHQTMPATSFRYAVPESWYTEHDVRKYGFHGTSHRWVADRAQEILAPTDKDQELGLITAHLGNGCSVSAVVGGKSQDTSMGMTPLAGTVMGTRSGTIDPGILPHVAEQTHTDIARVTNDLNKRSGLLGLSTSSNDMRTLSQAATNGDDKAQLAIDVFCYRLAQEILAMTAALPRFDGLIFTGGIGENAAPIRAQTLQHLHLLGLSIDDDANATHGRSNNGHIETEK